MKKFFKELKALFEIKENTPPFVVSGLMGSVFSFVLIILKVLLDALFK